MNRKQAYAEATELLGLGWNKDKIAVHLGITASGLRNVLNDPDGSKQKARRERYRRVCEGCGCKTDGSSGYNAPRLCVRCNNSAQRIWTKEAVVAAIQAWAKEHGHPPTASEWMTACPEGTHPATATVYRRSTHKSNRSAPFQYWADAIEAAGYERPTTGRRLDDPHWDRETVIAAIQQWVTRHADIPSMADWTRARPPFPAAVTACYYFGSWNAAISAAGFTPRRSSGQRRAA